jgi:hypothetical protein
MANQGAMVKRVLVAVVVLAAAWGAKRYFGIDLLGKQPTAPAGERATAPGGAGPAPSAPTTPGASAPTPDRSAPTPTRPPAGGPGAGTGTRATEAAGDAGERAILDAFKAQRSNVIVRTRGTVRKVLPDDDEGDRHQKFILRLAGGHTLLVAHNIDLAPRVPVREGEGVEIQGEYEWSAQGGVLHWTHHDPGKRREGGWIEHAGKRYE